MQQRFTTKRPKINEPFGPDGCLGLLSRARSKEEGGKQVATPERPLVLPSPSSPVVFLQNVCAGPAFWADRRRKALPLQAPLGCVGGTLQQGPRQHPVQLDAARDAALGARCLASDGAPADGGVAGNKPRPVCVEDILNMFVVTVHMMKWSVLCMRHGHHRLLSNEQDARGRAVS